MHQSRLKQQEPGGSCCRVQAQAARARSQGAAAAGCRLGCGSGHRLQRRHVMSSWRPAVLESPSRWNGMLQGNNKLPTTRHQPDMSSRE